MANQSPVTKIYELKTIGHDVTIKNIDNISKALDKLKKAKLDLDKILATTSDAKEYEDASRKINAITQKQAEVVTTSVGAYYKLNMEFKQAKENVANLAAEFGAESEQVREAIKVFEDYKSQITAIQNLVKNSGKSSSGPTTTSGVPGLSQEQLQTAQATGVAISELERKEAEAANAATAWVNSQVLGKEAVAGLGEEVERVKIPLEQYTGTLDANIKQNIQYKSRLQEIGSELRLLSKSTSSADKNTSDYRNRVAALTKEEKELKIASGELTQTINAQVKYLQAADSSYDQLNAELGLSRNLLRQLSDEEKKEPWALQLAKDVEKLDKGLKAMDASMGNHQRNVGNYASGFNGLNMSIQQILRETPSAAISLNTFFLAISNNLPILFDELKKAQLAIKSNTLATQEAAAAARLQAEASAIQAGATREAAAAEGLLAEQTAIANAKASQAPSIWAQVRNSLFSLNSFLTIGVLLLTLYGGKIVEWISGMFSAQATVNSLTLKMRDLVDVTKKAGESAQAETATLRVLESVATDTNKSMAVRLQAVKDLKEEYPKYLENLSNEAILNGEAAKQINLVADALLKKAFYEAASSKAAAKASENIDLQLRENFLVNEQIKYTKQLAKQRDDLRTRPHITEGDAVFLSQTEEKLNKVNDLLKKNRDQQKLNNEQVDYFTKLAANNYQALKSLEKPETPKRFNGSKISGEDKDRLSIIEANRRAELAIEETRVISLRKIRQLSYDEEREYFANSLAINQKYLNQKIALFDSQRKLNARERELLETFKKERADIELKAIQDLDNINKQEYTDRFNGLKNSFDLQVKSIQEANKLIQSDSRLSSLERQRADLDADIKILDQQLLFLQNMDGLQKRFGKMAVENEKRAAEDVQRTKAKIREEERRLEEAELIDSIRRQDEAADIRLSDLRKKIADATIKILQNKNLGTKGKANALVQLENSGTLQAYDLEIEKLKATMAEKFLLFAKGYKTEKEYREAVSALRQKEAERAKFFEGTQQSYIQKTIASFKDAINNLTGFFRGQKAAQKDIDDAIAAGVQSTKNAISTGFQAMFEAQNRRIDEEKDFTLKRLDLEEQQRLGVAQSEAEKDSIRRQYDKKREEAEKKASEQKKQVALKELAINFAVAVVKTLAEYPFPLSLIPVAGLTAAYFAERSLIQSQKFEHGGEVPSRGGRFGGRPHSKGGTPFNHKGNSFEAEVDELAVIRTRNAPANAVFKLVGTQQQIASQLNRIGGGVDFAPGGKAVKFASGGYLGDILQAPVFIPSVNNVIMNSNNDELVNEVRELRIENLRLADETSKRIDRIEVLQVTSTVTDAQKKQAKQSEIGTL